MDYEEIRLLKESTEGTFCLVREGNGKEVYVRKQLKGQYPVYLTLQNCRHPFLPELHEVVISDEGTTVIEEYIEGQSLDSLELSEREFRTVVEEMCSVLEFLHEKGIIHRDIKPSNIVMAKDGHIRLMDFDAARIIKDDLERDTRLLGTRGYAAPEQFGFAQTDQRSDIYSFGMTMRQLLGDRAKKPFYRRIIQKCTDLNPDKRYQSARQLRQAFSHMGLNVPCVFAAALLLLVLGIRFLYPSLPVLPAPENPRWDGETGMGVWGNVPDSGDEGEVRYRFKIYRRDEASVPDPERDQFDLESSMGGNWQKDEPEYYMNLSSFLGQNGFYYFAVASAGDGIHFADSPYVVSDAFEYTGESAPELDKPENLAWIVSESGNEPSYYAFWSNLDDYEDNDTFNVRVYNSAGDMVVNNIGTKANIMDLTVHGIWINSTFLSDKEESYRFTVQAISSRPNDFKSQDAPDPLAEENLSPALLFDERE